MPKSQWLCIEAVKTHNIARSIRGLVSLAMAFVDRLNKYTFDLRKLGQAADMSVRTLGGIVGSVLGSPSSRGEC